jgi:hypothetical protein
MKQGTRTPAGVSPEDVALDKELAHADIQQGTDQSIPKQEQLKEKVQQHPLRDLPRVESIEASETPPRV